MRSPAREVLPDELKRLTQPADPPPLENAYWIVPGRFMAGPYPGGFTGQAMTDAIGALLDAGVDYFIDLTEEGEVLAYTHLIMGKVHHTRWPIPDFDTPGAELMTRILDEIDWAIGQDHCVYLHCLAGLGRTGTVVGCYLVRHGLSGREALQALRTLRRETAFPRSASPQTEAQRRRVRRWES